MKKLVIFLLLGLVYMNISLAQQPACDYKVEIIIDGEEFEIEDFKWRMRATKIEGKSTNITGTAEIEDSNGKTVKSYKPWTSQSISKQKTSSEYTPNLKPGNYEITAEISVECDDTNKDNNIDKKEIKIKGEIEKANNKESKNEDIEAKTENTLTNDADNKQTATKPAKTAPKTTDEEIENTIQLANKNTQKIQESKPITSSTIQTPQIVYESSNERVKGWIMIFLLTLSILLNIILIWKR
ncbi:hypothetical protein J4448_02930 [Candidatus Woesearchaeota archaeon]|nr:hypothetical protein [Candidatus Woesearchaeota archaeon]